MGVVFGFLESSLRASREAPDPTLTTIIFVGIMVAGINVCAPLLIYLMGRLRHELERAEALLLNVLPTEISLQSRRRRERRFRVDTNR